MNEREPPSFFALNPYHPRSYAPKPLPPSQLPTNYHTSNVVKMSASAFFKTVSGALSPLAETTDNLDLGVHFLEGRVRALQEARVLVDGCVWPSEGTGNGTPSSPMGVKRTVCGARVSKSMHSVPRPELPMRLVSLAEARANPDIRLRGIDPAPVRMPFPTADFRNFNLISLAEAQNMDAIRYRTVI